MENNSITFTDLSLKLDDTVKIVNINNQDVEIKQYLPVEDKYDLIDTVLQNSYENGHYNPLKVDTFFHLYLVYLYSNIQFTDAQKEEPAKLFDLLYSSQTLDIILSGMNEKEYSLLVQMLEKEIELSTNFNNTLGATIKNLVDNLPINAEKAKEIVDKFNPEDFQNVLMMARQANGGRPIE
jgi:hypothetical protein